MTDLDRQRTARRAGGRLVLALLGVLAIALTAVPLGILVRAEHPALVEADLDVSRAAEDATGSSPVLLRAAELVTLLGDPVVVTGLPLLVALLLWRRGYGRRALFLVVVRVGASLLSSGMKAVVDRARPVFDEPVATALGASFPSGHALGSAACWASLAVLLMPYVRRDVLLLGGAVVVSSLVAASRVLLGVHFLSDVLAGMIIGLGWVAVCTAVFAVWRREQGRPVDVAEEGIGR